MTTTASASTSSTHPGRLLAMAGEQLARDRWFRDRLLAYQAERLRALIAHAVAASPYYRDLLGPDAAGGDVPLSELPTLPKATLMDNFDRIVTDPQLRRAELEAQLSGPAADRPYLGRYRLFTTAGTTGVRGLFVEDAGEFAVWSATCLRGLASWGLRPATRLAGIGSPSPLHISNQVYAMLLAGQPSDAPRLTVTTPVSQMVAGLVATTSEVQTADMRRRMAEAWGLEVVEVVDEHDRPVEPGVPGHKVLLTNLVGQAQPLLRYELTDSVTLTGGPNPLGLPYDPAGLHVAVVLREEAPADTPARVRAALALQLHDPGAVPPPIEVTPVPELRRDPGHGAKLKLIRSAATGSSPG